MVSTTYKIQMGGGTKAKMSSCSGNSVLAKSYLDLANTSKDKSIDDIEKTIITEANMASTNQREKCM